MIIERRGGDIGRCWAIDEYFENMYQIRYLKARGWKPSAFTKIRDDLGAAKISCNPADALPLAASGGSLNAGRRDG